MAKKIGDIETTDTRKELYDFLKKEVSQKLHNRDKVLKVIALYTVPKDSKSGDINLNTINGYKNIKDSIRSQIETKLASIIKDEDKNSEAA